MVSVTLCLPWCFIHSCLCFFVTAIAWQLTTSRRTRNQMTNGGHFLDWFYEPVIVFTGSSADLSSPSS